MTLVNPETSALTYCNSVIRYSRFMTREVRIGNIGIGGSNPIRLQSMTTTDTMNTIATVEQSIRMIEAGCELVRITAPSMNEARNLKNIKDELRKRGYTAPLIADIHFTPNAAEAAARIVEKVRVNPGNYADKKKFETIDYSDLSYTEELERIRERFSPLVKICKEHGTAMRIGTNHGSLSDRIMSRYGDSPLGMVESALEFVRICEEDNYFNLVLSMKSSNPKVMVEAYRLLVHQMISSGRNYPLHLGVTEAGEGEDGRIKSAAGIGTLLEDGLGDTIRVSLTEDPEFEIPVAKMLAERYSNRKSYPVADLTKGENSLEGFNPFEYKKRNSTPIQNLGGCEGSTNVPRIVADFSNTNPITQASLFAVGYNYSAELDKWRIADQACDYVYIGKQEITFELPGTIGVLCDADMWTDKKGLFPYFTFLEFQNSTTRSNVLNFVEITAGALKTLTKAEIKLLNSNVALVFTTESDHGMAVQRWMFTETNRLGIHAPVIIKRTYNLLTDEKVQLYAPTDMGALLMDGFGDGIWIEARKTNRARINSTAFGLLQATRTRISKTEYISCPSCGRTLFDLQETTAKIRSRTQHLKGLKIGIMGCIVNGPGEMADADYGYVGSGPGKITLYKGKEVVERSIKTEKAVDALIELIKTNGDWIDPR